jgi:segregation and condensation protein B
LEVSEGEIRESLENLRLMLNNRGIRLIITDREASLATAPEVKGLIEQIAKDELSKDIGKAGLETLAIILYNQGVSRREIDYIRGVNSAFILRNLSIRGLIEKEPDNKDQRTFRYRASLSLLGHLGITKIDELPNLTEFRTQINTALKNAAQNNE